MVRLVSVVGRTLNVRGVDMVDGTPALDIKPFVPQFDVPQVERIGWLEGRVERLNRARADGRFG